LFALNVSLLYSVRNMSVAVTAYILKQNSPANSFL
jgi:hypothetical protein